MGKDFVIEALLSDGHDNGEALEQKVEAAYHEFERLYPFHQSIVQEIADDMSAWLSATFGEDGWASCHDGALGAFFLVGFKTEEHQGMFAAQFPNRILPDPPENS